MLNNNLINKSKECFIIFVRITIVLILICGLVYPQKEGGEFPETELNIQVQNAPNATIQFELEPISTVWSYKSSTSPKFQIRTTATNWSEIDVGSGGNEDCVQNGYAYRFFNEDNSTVVAGCAQSSAGIRPVRNGLFKLSVYENYQLKTYIYLDWRDNGFPDGSHRSCSGGNDMTVRYNKSINKIEFWNEGSISEDNDNPDATLSAGALITWAELNCTPRSTTEMEDFWDNALVMTDNGNNPRIVWGPHPSFSTNSYKIYRAVSLTPLSNPEQSASLRATVNSSTFQWVDQEISSGSWYVYYYVKAYNGSYSDRTNIEEFRGVFAKQGSNEIAKNIKYSLAQNYPNPFNPSTQISYQISESGLVRLKVLNLLGQEVANLVDEFRESGSYVSDFDASHLSSGVYIYTLQVNDFYQSHKMSLIK